MSEHQERKIIAGIDPGVKTGLAIWSCGDQEFMELKTCSVIEAFEYLRNYKLSDNLDEIRFEDARLRKWFGNAGSEKLQGAGSVKRDCKIWQEFCEYYEIPFQSTKPAKGQTKWSAAYFRRMTGWSKRTSQHARDAAVLVFGVK
jgi:hypothetical protein